mmetsp:Transcript_18765/g.36767  ORF Transcript_18765/g.36767 Transcript_18765/m.36767 type:complete len:107 (-) Transcript_18765:13-333(-)
MPPGPPPWQQEGPNQTQAFNDVHAIFMCKSMTAFFHSFILSCIPMIVHNKELFSCVPPPKTSLATTQVIEYKDLTTCDAACDRCTCDWHKSPRRPERHARAARWPA